MNDITPVMIFDEGYTAHVQGFDISDNPYPSGTEENMIWNDGFIRSEEQYRYEYD